MAILTLAIFGAAAGLAILWVFKALSNQHALKATRRQLRAHLLAIRLFGDDPAMVLRSQGKLLAWNARYVALLMPSFIVVAIALFFAWDYLDALWGRVPLAPGQSVVVTARLRGEPKPLTLIAPAWLRLESPAVRGLADREVSWRVRVREAGAGEIAICAAADCARTWVEARPGMHYLRERTRPASRAIEWVEVPYPPGDLRLAGVSANWVVWFCIVSTLSALVFRGRLRVTF
ncbi:MAG TPA: hypothetical protein VF767_10055 [Bryobacteraceae bacterium]